MNYKDLQFNLGNQQIVNQQNAKKRLSLVLQSGRVAHAYLLTGPAGSGKAALALAFAEILNGIDHLTDLGNQKFSTKSSWFTHPDIHLFLPMPTKYQLEDLRERLALLAENPYNLVNFNERPSIAKDDSSKNKQAFYPIDYFHDEIRPKAFLKPNEGKKTIIILTEIELMRESAANAFLKLLEEPADNLVFILTTAHYDALLPTIQSRCQQIKLNALSPTDIETALIEKEKIVPEDAKYIAHVSGGNYKMARFYDAQSIKQSQDEIVAYLRYAYGNKAVDLTQIITEWHQNLNIQRQLMLLNMLEIFLRDLMIYRDTGDEAFVTNTNQLKTIQNFCSNLKDAAIHNMVDEVNRCRPLIQQNVQAKLVFTTLAFRLSALMRNHPMPLAHNNPWKHLPTFVN